MKGRVPGAEDSGGSVSDEDGKRYRFDIGAARIPPPIRHPGNKAKALAGTDTAQHPIRLLTGNRYFQISLAILLASFSLGFLRIGHGLLPGSDLPASDALAGGGIGSCSLLGMSDLADAVRAFCDAALSGVSQMKRQVREMYGSDPTAGQRRFGFDLDGWINTLATLNSLTLLLYLPYLAPLGAGFTIVRLVRRAPARLAALLTGAGCVTAFAAPFVWRMLFVSEVV